MEKYKIKLSDIKVELTKLITFFKERDAYKVELRKNIKLYGIANLPPVVQRSIPTDMKVLYEIKWWLQLGIWVSIARTAFLRAQTEGVRRALHG